MYHTRGLRIAHSITYSRAKTEWLKLQYICEWKQIKKLPKEDHCLVKKTDANNPITEGRKEDLAGTGVRCWEEGTPLRKRCWGQIRRTARIYVGKKGGECITDETVACAESWGWKRPGTARSRYKPYRCLCEETRQVGRVQIILLSEAEEVASSQFPPHSHFHRKPRFKRVSDLPKGSIDIKQ